MAIRFGIIRSLWTGCKQLVEHWDKSFSGMGRGGRMGNHEWETSGTCGEFCRERKQRRGVESRRAVRKGGLCWKTEDIPAHAHW